MRTPKLLVISTALACTVSRVTAGQTTLGVIAGSVTDTSGAVVVGAAS